MHGENLKLMKQLFRAGQVTKDNMVYGLCILDT